MRTSGRSGRNLDRLKMAPLVATIFCCVSGGPFGLEPVMQSGIGMGLLLILVTPLIWSIPVALLTAELTSAIPAEGGYYVWVRQAMGPFAGFLCGWWSWVNSWVDVAIYPTLFAAYVHSLIGQLGGASPIEAHPWIKWLTGLAIVVPFTALNIRGVRGVGAASQRFAPLLMAPFALIVALGLARSGFHPPMSLVVHGKSAAGAFSAGLFVVMWNYLGWDSMSTLAGEVDQPQKTFPRAIAICVPLVILSYFLPSLIGVALLPNPSDWVEGAWTRVAGLVGGRWLAVAMSLAGIVSAAGLFSSTLLAASRVPMVLAQDGYLPKSLARLSPRFGTPVTAICVSAVIYTALSFQSFKSLASLDVVLYSAGLVLELAALLLLRAHEPELARPYKIPGGWPALAAIALFPSLMIVFAVVMQCKDPDQGGVAFAILSLVGLASGPVVYVAGKPFRRRFT